MNITHVYTHIHRWDTHTHTNVRRQTESFFLLLWTVVSLVKDKEISKRKGGKG